MNKYIEQALEEAKKAYSIGEVPVGAVIVKEGLIIGRGHNRVESDKDPTAHAEILTIKDACQNIGAWRLEGCDIYVTLEPCAMCAGAIVQARLDRVYFGAKDWRKGCCGTVHNLVEDENFNHRARPYYLGVEECASILTSFFEKIRGK